MEKSQFNKDEIEKYWTEQAKKHQSFKASWSDINAIRLENKNILKHLDDGQTVLDVGCASGYSTVKYACAKNIHITGVDYIEEMIDSANKTKDSLPSDIAERINFEVRNIKQLDFEPNSFDRVITTRVIINLEDWESQKESIISCSQPLKKGGLLLISEAAVQGLNKLNALREEVNMPNLTMPDFNYYLDMDIMTSTAWPDMQLIDIQDFSSTYYILTRYFKPLLSKLNSVDIDIANPTSELNNMAAAFPACGDYGIQKLFVFQKL